MTTEHEYTPPPPFPEAGFVVFGIPGVPYSSVHLPLVWNTDEFNVLVAQAMESAKIVKEAYDEAFGPTTYQVMPNGVIDTVPPQRAQQSQRAPQQRPQQQGTRRATDLDPNLVVQGNCPEHGVKALPSKLEYQEIELDADTGEERYAKYFCPGKDNGTGRNHQLYARQLV